MQLYVYNCTHCVRRGYNWITDRRNRSNNIATQEKKVEVIKDASGEFKIESGAVKKLHRATYCNIFFLK